MESLSVQSTPEIKPGVREIRCQIDGVRIKDQSTWFEQLSSYTHTLKEKNSTPKKHVQGWVRPWNMQLGQLECQNKTKHTMVKGDITQQAIKISQEKRETFNKVENGRLEEKCAFSLPVNILFLGATQLTCWKCRTARHHDTNSKISVAT